MRYVERAAGSRLRSLVDRFWALETTADDPPTPSPVLPDGHVEVMVHVGAPFAEVGADGRPHVQSRVLYGAQILEAARLVSASSGLVVGARLHPWAGALLTGVPQHELTGGIHDLSAINKRAAARLAQHLAGRDDVDEAMAAFEGMLAAVFAQRIAQASDLVPPTVIAATTHAQRTGGLVRVDQLAASVGLSTRQLERQFALHVGLSPKQLLRVLRFQQVMAALREPDPGDWPDLAVRLGFYDQAHFINDFRRFTGESPGAWAIDDDSLTAVFLTRRLRE